MWTEIAANRARRATSKHPTVIPVTRALPGLKELFDGDDWAEEESCPEEVLKLSRDPPIGTVVCFPILLEAVWSPIEVATGKAGGTNVVESAVDRELFAALDRLIASSVVEDPRMPVEERMGGIVLPRHAESLLDKMVNHCSCED